MALYYPDRLESNNPAAYGIVKALEVAGHKTVATLDELYALADVILSDSGTNENNDAIGQRWYVISEARYYQLTEWNSRTTASGWTEVAESSDIVSEVGEYTINGYKISSNPTLTKEDVGLGNVDNTSDLDKPVSTAQQAAIDSAVSTVGAYTVNGYAISSNPELTKSDIGLSNVTNDAQVKRTEMGVAGGVATLDESGTVPASQLPSYVDDVLEYETSSAFPSPGESGKIYVALDTNLTYRWSGSTYIEISQSIALGETSSTAYAGDKGKAVTDRVNEVYGSNSVISGTTDVVFDDDDSSDSTLSAADALVAWDGSNGTSDLKIPYATSSKAGVMSSTDKGRMDDIYTGLYDGNLELVSPTITGTWTFYNQSDEEVAASSIANNPTTTGSPTLEDGYKAQFSGTYVWTSEDGKKDPTSLGTSNWSTLTASGVTSDTYTSDKLTTGTTIRVTLQAAKTGFMVNSSDSSIIPASGNDTTTATRTVSFSYRRYFGVMTGNTVSEANIKALSSELSSSKSKTITGITCDTTQYYVYAYPQSLGTLSTIIQDGATPVLGAFTQSTLTITNDAGKSVPLYVYVSNNPGAFTSAQLAFS